MPSDSLLRTKKKKLWLPNLSQKKNVKRSPQKSKPVQVWLKADFVDGTIFAYDYRARLPYVKTFDHPYVHNFFTYDKCRGSNLHYTICREVMTYANRAR